MEIWKKKFTSRKFWAAIAAFLTALVLALFGDSLDESLLEILRQGFGALCVYIGGESLVDAVSLFRGNGTSTKSQDSA